MARGAGWEKKDSYDKLRAVSFGGEVVRLSGCCLRLVAATTSLSLSLVTLDAECEAEPEVSSKVNIPYCHPAMESR